MGGPEEPGVTGGTAGVLLILVLGALPGFAQDFSTSRSLDLGTEVPAASTVSSVVTSAVPHDSSAAASQFSDVQDNEPIAVTDRPPSELPSTIGASESGTEEPQESNRSVTATAASQNPESRGGTEPNLTQPPPTTRSAAVTEDVTAGITGTAAEGPRLPNTAVASSQRPSTTAKGSQRPSTTAKGSQRSSTTAEGSRRPSTNTEGPQQPSTASAQTRNITATLPDSPQPAAITTALTAERTSASAADRPVTSAATAAQPTQTVATPHTSRPEELRDPSQLEVGDHKDIANLHSGSGSNPLFVMIVSVFTVVVVMVVVAVGFHRYKKRNRRTDFRRLQDLPMDDMMEDTPLALYSY